MQHYSFTFDLPEPQRLDQFIASKLPDVSRSYLKKLVAEELVKVDGKAVKASRVLRGHEEIVVELPEAKPLEIKEEIIPLEILFEDSYVVVVNKPAGMVVHPAPGHESGTLVNALAGYCDDLSGVGGTMRPGIVHRLDVGTTGVILVAKNDKAHLSLADQFQKREISKRYRAIAFGKVTPEEGEIDIAIGRDQKDRKKMSPNTLLPREALTRYKLLSKWDDFSLLDIDLLTGRTHQIRVHFAHLRFPLVGDLLYGGNRYRGVRDSREKKMAGRFPRPALHAHIVKFRHPDSGEEIRIEAPIPEDIQKFVTRLGEPI